MHQSDKFSILLRRLISFYNTVEARKARVYLTWNKWNTDVIHFLSETLHSIVFVDKLPGKSEYFFNQVLSLVADLGMTKNLLDCYIVLTRSLSDSQWGMKCGLQLADVVTCTIIGKSTYRLGDYYGSSAFFHVLLCIVASCEWWELETIFQRPLEPDCGRVYEIVMKAVCVGILLEKSG